MHPRCDVHEVEVSRAMLDRLDESALTRADIALIGQTRAVRPSRWTDYVVAIYGVEGVDKSVWHSFRRLEDLVRTRTGLSEHGYKLFSQAFTVDKSKLKWALADGGEQAGRAQLFTGAFMAFRNPRAHRKARSHTRDSLAEFLLLNQLFILEREAIERPQEPDATSEKPEG